MLETIGAGHVSILARPSRAGRPINQTAILAIFAVSILARPSRAGRPGQHRGGDGSWLDVSILARPSRAGRQCRHYDDATDQAVSILARPSRAGRPHRTENSVSCLRRFNPRPTLAGRASRVCRVRDRLLGVSILARPSRAGRHYNVDFWTCVAEFQSSPDPRGPGVPFHPGQ